MNESKKKFKYEIHTKIINLRMQKKNLKL